MATTIMDALFQRTLEDLIKQSRLNLIPEPTFLSRSLDEIRKELRATDLQTKSIALRKLCYLSSLYHVDMSWASFHCIECMSSSSFAIKRIGYVSASQSFDEGTPVLLLATHQLRKDMMSSSVFDSGLALGCFSLMANGDLAKDLCNEVFALLGSSKVLVRKRAIGVTVRLFEKYPDAVRVCFKRLVESLESSDSEVLSGAVSVFCELARKDPASYLPLAPEFYKVLVGSRNNWVLIKILKVFARLVSLEPRLAKRVVEPVCEVMRRTGAKSLVFECVRMVLSSLSEFESAVRLALEKVREFLQDDDPNLKYLGLHALSIAAEKHLWAVLENKEVVTKSLSSEDVNIKREALRLVMAMVSEDNIVEISQVLLNYALKSDPEFCNEILGSILSTCSRNLYEIVIDFDWYVSLLGEMATVFHCQKGEEIEKQLVDIGMRVKDARPELVRIARGLLIDPALLGNLSLHRILSAAAWVSGEYLEFSKSPFELVEALLQPRTDMLPPSIRAIYLQSVFKVLIFVASSNFMERDLNSVSFHQSSAIPGETSKGESIINLLNLVESSVTPLLGSPDVEVLERARNVVGLVELIRNEMSIQEQNEELGFLKLVNLLNDAVSEDLGPVSWNAPDRVSLPDGLILRDNLKELDAVLGGIELPSSSPFSVGVGSLFGEKTDATSSDSRVIEDLEVTNESNESTSLLSEHRRRHGLYYLPSEKSTNGAYDYPPANDPKSEEAGTSGDADDLVKLATQSFVSKKRPSNAKLRPVVVKLDEVDAVPVEQKRAESNDNLLSDAIREILSAGEAARGIAGANTFPPEESKENSRPIKSSSRKGKHRSHHRKEKDSSHSGKQERDREGNSRSRRHGDGRRTRERAGDSASVMAVATIVPDFLLE
ncbi:hypothetical protein MLD38_032837 [Melastoma candidum]|uniref:Uncharacterized protein n=1 Tax=Melastoma candidum TaxID=119954 RepID=A0ACB9M4Z8_9MYRT|nr:hypothetical protein MLD38_032837 [Melastoma candidum]